jgi:predicted ATPase
LNRGVALITSAEEREQLAELNLVAGRRAMASSAYASALTYLITGMALRGHEGWERRRELRFELELARAECKFLTGELATASGRLTALSRRTATNIERAALASLHIGVFIERTSAIAM